MFKICTEQKLQLSLKYPPETVGAALFYFQNAKIEGRFLQKKNHVYFIWGQ